MIRPIVFGKFCLLERVNVGGMAELYRAKMLNAPHFNRHIAIKRILPNLAEDKEFITMFIDEAKITCEMNHPCICQIYELGRLQDTHYIAMEYIAGKDLLQMQSRYRRQKKIMSVAQASFIIAQVAMGLDFAHRAVDQTTGQPLNIVHRDVSPQNVLISYEGLIKLIDFGVAKAASKNSKTQAGVLKGKFGYMSPEQVDGNDIDHRSDVFALGTLFWECLTGRRLFQGDNDFVTLELVRECKIEPPSKYNHLVPPEIEAICMRALKRDRTYRYQWAGELSRDLWTFINSQNPPYSQWHLQQWMCSNFQEDLEKEWAKIPIFQSINTQEDVVNFNAQQLAQAEAAMLLASGASEPTRDFEGNIVPELQDMHDSSAQQNIAGNFSYDDDASAEESLPEIPDGHNPVETPSENPLHQSIYMDAFPHQQSSGGKGGTIAIILILLLVIGGGGAAAWFFYFQHQDSEAATPAKAKPTIVVKPEDPGATITISKEDGTVVAEHTGSTFAMPELEPGDFTIEVTHPRFETVKEKITFADGEREYPIPMVVAKKTFGNLTIKVTPADAVVTARDPEDKEITLEAGESEDTREAKLLAGASYELKIFRHGYVPATHMAEIHENETNELSFELEKGVGEITIKGSPIGTIVYKANEEGKMKKVGSTPQTFEELDPTVEHQFEVRKSGYKTEEYAIQFEESNFVAPNKYVKTILARLERK